MQETVVKTSLLVYRMHFSWIYSETKQKYTQKPTNRFCRKDMCKVSGYPVFTIIPECFPCARNLHSAVD